MQTQGANNSAGRGNMLFKDLLAFHFSGSTVANPLIPSGLKLLPGQRFSLLVMYICCTECVGLACGG